MSQITIKRRGWWGSIPESLLTDLRLSHAAVRLGAWLAMRQDGWQVRKTHAREVLGISETLWDKSCTELKQAGYLTTIPLRSQGRFRGYDYIFDPTPNPPEAVLPAPVNTRGGEAEAGAAGAGKTAHLLSTCITSTNQINTTTTTTKAVNMIWPPSVAQSQQAACIAVMGRLNMEQQQMLLDELAGQTKPVANPVGWLRRLAKLAETGQFQADLAGQVRAAREALARANVHVAKAVTRPPNAEEKARIAALLREGGMISSSGCAATNGATSTLQGS